MSANPPARKLSPLTCELGGHSGNFSIYRAKVGDQWGCHACIVEALGAVPKWLKP